MKRIIIVTAIAVLVAAGSLACGTSRAQRSGEASGASQTAKVYICPMHPEYHTDHPGDCPICGMHLEPKPEARSANGNATPALPRGAVQISSDQQQSVGIKLGVVEKLAGTRMLRTTGRVVPDENRTYPVVAAVSGWIRNVESVTTGDAVKADQVLATFAAPQPEFDSAQQMYYTNLEMLYRASSQPRFQSHDVGREGGEIERVADGLRNMGVSNSQLRQMAKRREPVQDILVESPVDGFILKRNVSPGMRFDRGFEFYRIADLNRVWILADVYRDQLPFIRHGASARITASDSSLTSTATVSQSEPTFDQTALTLQVRLEAANPKLALKPGMFVNVEFPVNLPPTLVVPSDAIVDSGLHKTVFVDCGNGCFEPRLIETGWRMGDEVEVTKGLVAGERIVVSGTFLVDSETRMKVAKR